MDEHKSKKTKFGAFGTSLFLHGAILLAIATLTVELTMPEGNVTGSVEFDTVVPEGQQLKTVDVAPVAQPEAPDLAKKRAAPAPPPPPPVSAQKPDNVPDDFLATDNQGEMPVAINEEPEVAEKTPEPEPEPEVPPPPVVLPQKTVVDEPEPVKSPDPTPQPAPVIGQGAPTAVNAGADAADIKGQQEVADQNYGTVNGVKNADIYLRAVAGNRQPEYPWSARLRRIEGQVVAMMYVNQQGEVSNVRITQSSHEIFNEPVLTALKSWRFKPPVEAGEYAKPFNFVLKGDAKDKPTLLRRKGQ